MKVDNDDNSRGMWNNPNQSAPLLETLICKPSMKSAKKTLQATSLKNHVGQKRNIPQIEGITFVDLTIEDKDDNVANAIPLSEMDNV